MTSRNLLQFFSSLAAAAVWLAASAHGHAAPATALVVCSPGSPGTTDEAQPRMDALAQAVSTRAGGQITAVYEPTEAGGVTRLKAAGIGLVSLPFFLQHEHDLGLHARLAVVAKGRPALERWALVAAAGKVKQAPALAGFTIATSAAFAPAFVRGVVLGGFGALPADAKLAPATAVLSSLRRAANGESVAVVLDGPAQASLGTLPFAAKLEVVTRSPAVPAAVIATIDARMPDKAWSAIERALLGLASDRAAAAVLDGIEVAKFAPIDDAALGQARKAFADASR